MLRMCTRRWRFATDVPAASVSLRVDRTEPLAGRVVRRSLFSLGVWVG